jgi:hypothetical protein
MTDQTIPELWQWAECSCPWSYIAAVRLYHVYPEYEHRVRLRVRPFPLEVMGGEAAPRAILEQEWWLAAIQEPRAAFEPWHGATWPTTTLPTFEAAWYAARQDDIHARVELIGELRLCFRAGPHRIEAGALELRDDQLGVELVVLDKQCPQACAHSPGLSASVLAGSLCRTSGGAVALCTWQRGTLGAHVVALCSEPMVKWNVAPCTDVASAHIRPPCQWVMRWQVALPTWCTR